MSNTYIASTVKNETFDKLLTFHGMLGKSIDKQSYVSAFTVHRRRFGPKRTFARLSALLVPTGCILACTDTVGRLPKLFLNIFAIFQPQKLSEAIR